MKYVLSLFLILVLTSCNSVRNCNVKPGVEMYKKKSKVHGTGLFASRKIKKGTTIIEYIGEKVKKKIGYKRADKHLPKVWIFELSHHYLIDGKFPRNHARLINHSCDPNCDIKIKKDHIWIYAKKDINKN